MSKPNRRSIRLPGYDYTQNGAYYVTICVHNMAHLFGYVKNGQMVLNRFGQIVSEEWIKTGQIRQEIILDAFVIMPHHMDAIVVIWGTDGCFGRGTARRAPTCIRDDGDTCRAPTTMERFGQPVLVRCRPLSDHSNPLPQNTSMKSARHQDCRSGNVITTSAWLGTLANYTSFAYISSIIRSNGRKDMIYKLKG